MSFNCHSTSKMQIFEKPLEVDNYSVDIFNCLYASAMNNGIDYLMIGWVGETMSSYM